MTATEPSAPLSDERVAKIIDPDAWHETLPTDGCGAYWIGRRKTALGKAATIAALSASIPSTAPGGVLCNMGVGCEEHGFCYAEAQGAPDRCGKLTTTAQGEVVQADRQNAYNLMLKIGRVSPLYEAAIMAGEWDHCDEVQAFRNHRLQATRECARCRG